MNGNTNISEACQRAYKRIKILQEVSRKTGLHTKDEQFRVLLALDNDDTLALAELLHKDFQAERMVRQ